MTGANPGCTFVGASPCVHGSSPDASSLEVSDRQTLSATRYGMKHQTVPQRSRESRAHRPLPEKKAGTPNLELVSSLATATVPYTPTNTYE
jgi:hypothetical protein